jgi:hypothetical protein
MRLSTRQIAALLLLPGTASPSLATGLVDRQACLDKGNYAAQCECLESQVEKRVRAGLKPEAFQAMRKGEGGTVGEDLTAMGVLMEATAAAAKACHVKLK